MYFAPPQQHENQEGVSMLSPPCTSGGYELACTPEGQTFLKAFFIKISRFCRNIFLVALHDYLSTNAYCIYAYPVPANPGSFYTAPEKFENPDLFLWFGPVYTNPLGKRNFRNCFANRKNLKTSAFRFLADGKKKTELGLNEPGSAYKIRHENRD